MHVDSTGNVFITGSLLGNATNTISFDSILFNSFPSQYYFDAFIVQYDSNGNAVWAKQFATNTSEEGTGIDVDNSGNIYVTGYYKKSITFGSFYLSNPSSVYTNVFVIKCDANGNVLWAKKAQGTGYDEGTGITVDKNGNSYITGHFTSSTISFDSITLNSMFGEDMFIAKLDSTNTVGILTINNKVSDINIFPNPTSGKITIRSNSNIGFIEIYNILGEKVYSLTPTPIFQEKGEGERVLDISPQPSGIYFLQLEQEGKIYNSKVVVE